MKKHALRITREQNFADWYLEVIKEANLAEHSGVRGCMVIKPWGYAIWERVQRKLDELIRETGHDNCYFPIFIPLDLIEKEATHVEGFAKEMAVVTHHRLIKDEDGKLVPAAPLEVPLVVRPTSETMIGEAFARWIQSYRDLPLKVNQWANVVRWEMRPRLFLRTSEFLWQEGHTAHATRDEALDETRQMLEVYRKVVEDMMMIPVIPGVKTPGERFPGAEETHSIEAMMQDGRALQAGTSHFLGQNFSRAASIQFQDKDGTTRLVYTTSWGASTRLIGALIMTHADDDGLRLPPVIAPRQVVIVPILRGSEADAAVLAAAHALADRLKGIGYHGEHVRAFVDGRDINAAEKRWEWIKKGVPLVCELGPRDLEGKTIAVTRRDRIAGKKEILPVEGFAGGLVGMLRELEQLLLREALAFRQARTREDIATYEAFKEFFKADDGTGFVIAKWSADPASEAKLAELGVTIRCLPYKQDGKPGRCVLTGAPATTEAVFAKAY
jgi:prolyl-tRNA synthetase